MTAYDAVSIIGAKRDGEELSDAQIDWALAAFTRGEMADEQMAALAMAIVLRGMNRRETARWTEAMIRSGRRLDFTDLTRPTVDKHSTGGVGDKITLALTPLVAACGAAVPQLSGRGLGYTGGTLDKLEAIPGWLADIGPDRMREILTDPAAGCVVCAAGADLAPADKRLYALRDTTGTVESIPLIAASIMSKKIAEGTAALVLDVKVGSGAFMRTREEARALATTMVELGADAGVDTVALLTAMDTPLGRTAGNALEVAEAVEVLAGGGPSDVVELTMVLAREMVALAGLDIDPAGALADGRAMDHWRAMIRAQGGDPAAPLPTAAHTETLSAPSSGILTRLDARGVGIAAWRLGAGRARQGDPVQAGAGIRWHAGPGERVTAGQPLLTLHTDTPETFPRAFDALAETITVEAESGAGAGAGRGPLILDRIPSVRHSDHRWSPHRYAGHPPARSGLGTAHPHPHPAADHPGNSE
ncbi:thymidine phosphorylase [Nocardia sp. NPDC003963]